MIRTLSVKTSVELEQRVESVLARLPLSSKSIVVRAALERGLAVLVRELDEGKLR